MLEFDTIGEDHFRARHNLENFAGSVFGGQAIGQTLAAARLTAPDWPASMVSGLFLRAGRMDRPIDFAVERTSDSRRFATRRVVASQDGRAMFDMVCSFHDGEPGIEHQFVDIAGIARPEDLPTPESWVAANPARAGRLGALFERPYPMELRLPEPDLFFGASGPPRRDFWLRMPSAAELDRPAEHEALLALMSDYWVNAVTLAPHGGTTAAGGHMMVSLNHGLWIHAPVRVDDWLLCRTRTEWAGNGRGLAHGQTFDSAGRLITTVTQEALIRRL